MQNTFTIQFNSDIAKDNTEIRIAFYANIGFFIEIAQMLEFNLRKLICYELSVERIEECELTKENVSTICDEFDTYYKGTYSEKWTLGSLLGGIEKLPSLTPEITSIIKEISTYRNILIHKIFQNNIITQNLESADTVNDYIEHYLIPKTNQAKNLNDFVINIINIFRDTLHDYKKQVGLPIPND